MTEDKQLFLFGHTLPGNENLLLERIKECAEKRNKGYCSTSPGCTVLRKIPAEDVLQVTAGHNYVAFLLKDHRVARLRYEIVANTIESTAPTDKNESGPGSSTAPATTTADIEGEGEADSISNIESCGLRAAVLSKNGLVGSFVDISCGNRLGRILSETPIEMPEPVDKLLCCTLYSAVLTKNGNVFWRGIYPFNERRKIWEKIRARKKQVTFESCGLEIVVGSEVRTKSTPIYSFGSIAVNFSQGIPMIGVLYEDAWTLNETCRFRVFGSANAYDNYNGEKLQQQKEKRSHGVGPNILVAGNRKRNAPSAQAENEQRQSSTTAQPSSGSGSTAANNNSDFAGKESAWNLKDCI
uniref:Uncharacterized protein n=1 Tax=Meloidogyne floridensis TaxID=298350 RepID=A0A915NMV0_9BILA